jgi:hypothetical protein
MRWIDRLLARWGLQVRREITLTTTSEGFHFRQVWPRQDVVVRLDEITELVGFLHGPLDDVCCAVTYRREGEESTLIIDEEMPGWWPVLKLFESLPGFRPELLNSIWHPTQPSPVTVFKRGDTAAELDLAPPGSAVIR